MVKVERAYGTTPTVGSEVAIIQHDGLGRRIAKEVKNSGDWDNTYHYYYSGQQMIETRNADAGGQQTLKQHVWGLQYVDELLQIAINTDPAADNDCLDSGGGASYWALQDANYNVLGIVDSDGALTERYEYTPYGQRTVYKSTGPDDPLCMSPLLESQRVTANGSEASYGLCDIGHQGLMHDKEFGLIYNRARYLHPRLGRFLTPDPLNANQARGGYQDGMNLYEYVRSRPTVFTDPQGLTVVPNQIITPQKALSKVLGVYLGVKARESSAGMNTRTLSLSRNHLTLLHLGWRTWNPGGTGAGSNQFLFTCKWGFIDLGHFFINASWHYGAPGDSTAKAGQNMEKFQDFLRRHGGFGDAGDSAYTMEDLNSNIQGATFGRNLGLRDHDAVHTEYLIHMQDMRKAEKDNDPLERLSLRREFLKTPSDGMNSAAIEFAIWLEENGAVTFPPREKDPAFGLLQLEAKLWMEDGKYMNHLRFKEASAALEFMKGTHVWRCLCDANTSMPKKGYRYYAGAMGRYD